DVVARLVALGGEALRQRQAVPLVTLPTVPLAEKAEQVRHWCQEFLNILNTCWDHERRAARALTYGDLQRTLEQALATQPALARGVRAGCSCALVDDFGATARVHWAICDGMCARWAVLEYAPVAPSLLAGTGHPRRPTYRCGGGDIHPHWPPRGKAAGEPAAL